MSAATKTKEIKTKETEMVRDRGPTCTTTFEAVPGRVYELRLLLQRASRGRHGKNLSTCEVGLTFRNAEGTFLDPHLVCDQPLIPGLDPAEVEVLPPCELTDEISAGGLASRFLIAPPDAARLDVELQTEGVECRRMELEPLNVLWSANEGLRAREEIRQACQQRRKLLKRHLSLGRKSSAALDAMCHIPDQQIGWIIERFAPKGDWQPVLAAMEQSAEHADFRLRMDKLRAQAGRLPRVGFIGSERGHERLCGMSEIFWLREAEYADQLALLDLDLVVIESTPSSGAGAEDTDWNLAFSSLDGTLPQRGATFLESASAHSIPVHLWVTTAPGLAKLWRGCAAVVGRVIAEGEDEDWSDLGRKHQTVPRATEPTACSLASHVPARDNLMLIPTGSDILKFPSLASLLSRQTSFRTLVTEFQYRFNPQNIHNRLNGRLVDVFCDHTRSQERQLLQAATIVLLPAATQRSLADLEAVALDAIASGALPVIFGTVGPGSSILRELPSCNSAVELMEFESLACVHWYWEREWRRLMHFMMKKHRWRAPHRRVLLGYDPFSKHFDQPRISVLLVTNRQHLVQLCLEKFRRQTWPNKELILVLNMDEWPSGIPRRRENEHMFLLPTSANIGECLNRGMAVATGRYWAKMDDDDHYAFTYLEDTIYYYRSTQADVVGRNVPYYYFSSDETTRLRLGPIKQRFWLITTRGHISGATLSAIRGNGVPGFSFKDRTSADSNWVRRVKNEGYRVFGADIASIVVFRDTDDSKHTWSIAKEENLAKSFHHFYKGHVGDLFENTENEIRRLLPP